MEEDAQGLGNQDVLIPARKPGGRLLRFCVSGALAFLLDNAVFAFLTWCLAEGGLSRKAYAFVSLAFARTVSSHFNYACNRLVVFRSGRPSRHRGTSYFRYMGLVALIGAASYACTLAASEFLDVRGVAMTAVKVAVDTFLFFVSYWLQKHFVFRRHSA